MAFVDTNALLRLIIGDVPKQAQEVEAAMEHAAPGELIVLDAIFIEMCFVMEFDPVYRFSRAYIYKALKRICDTSVFAVSRTARLAIEQYNADAKVDFMDCLLITEAREKRQTVLSFDKRLQKVLATSKG